MNKQTSDLPEKIKLPRRVKHSSRIELSQSALKKNINFIRKKIGSHPRISSVVKANAYGHGIPLMVEMLEKCGVNHFSVASAFEAEEVLDHCSPSSQIMIMGILYDEDVAWAIQNNISFFVFTVERLKLALEKAKILGKKALIHIELETGTNRTGMTEETFKQAISFMRKNQDYLQFEGICTHLGGAESMSNYFKIEQQKRLFEEYLKRLRKVKFMPNCIHMACSAAALVMPDTLYDMVRVGVATYGFWPSQEIYFQHLQAVNKKKDAPLRRVISWKTDVMDLKLVAKGEFIGYGTSFQATQDMKIAVLPLGYSNGYPRGQSNNGYVLINGKKAPICGLINMNLFMVDITHIPNVHIGDTVVLLGKQKNSTINVSSFTNFAQLLNNEMLSRLPTAIPRMRVK